VIGLQQPKLPLLMLPERVSSTREELIASSVHSVEDFCEIGWREIPPKENIEGIFQTAHLCVVPLSTMYRLRLHLRLEFQAQYMAYAVTADEQAWFQFLPLKQLTTTTSFSFCLVN